MRPWFRIFLLALLLSIPASAGADKPNILFLFADDLCFRALGHVGGEVQTPNLDRLAAEGTRFTHAYNSGAWNGAVCVASRAMLMTGRQLWFAQREQKSSRKEFQERKRTWPQLMQAAGYDTYMTGKWHVQMDAEKVFQFTRRVDPGGMPKTVEGAYSRPVEGQPDRWNPADPSVGGFWEGGKHRSAVQADTAIEFLGEARDREKPFFMYIAFNAPHDPRQSPQEFLDRYPIDAVPLPANFAPSYPFRRPMGCPHSLRDEKLAPMPRTGFAVKTHRREYYAIISHLDAQIGRILEALEENGQRGNTFVVFSADHGLAVGEHGLLGKQNMYDHSVRVPWVVRGPGVAAGKTLSAPIYLQDIVPTALEWAGAEVPEHVQFESIVPRLEGKGKPREAIYGGYLDKQRAVSKDGYKLIVYPTIKKARLYHVAEDPLETKDLLVEPNESALARARALLGELNRLEKEMGGSQQIEADL